MSGEDSVFADFHMIKLPELSACLLNTTRN